MIREFVARNLVVHNEKVMGCLRHERDTLLAFGVGDEKSDDIVDIFLTREQTVELHRKLTERLERGA